MSIEPGELYINVSKIVNGHVAINIKIEILEGSVNLIDIVLAKTGSYGRILRQQKLIEIALKPTHLLNLRKDRIKFSLNSYILAVSCMCLRAYLI